MKNSKQIRRCAAGCLILLLMLSGSGCGTSAGHQAEAASEPSAPMSAQETAMPAENKPEQNVKDTEAEASAAEETASMEAPASADEQEASAEASFEEAASARNAGWDTASAEEEQTVVKDTISPLQQQVNALVKSFSGTWAVYFKRLDTGESFSINEQSMVAASLIKLWIYGAAAQQIEKGKLAEDYYSSTMLPMISVSDNTAANTMIDAVGGMDAVNCFISAQGWKQTQLNRKMLAPDPVENYTSVSECGDLLEQVYNGTYVSKTASKKLLDAMLSQTRCTKIPAGLPAGTKCANKTGELSAVENDAAIVYSPKCTYILVVMSDDIASGTAQSNIAALSKTVYDYLNP